jgi:hypothetical protein
MKHKHFLSLDQKEKKKKHIEHNCRKAKSYTYDTTQVSKGQKIKKLNLTHPEQ